MASLPTILLILAALSMGATVIAGLIAFRSQREATSAIFPIVREEEINRARRARISIFVWIAITALFIGGWLASLRLATPVQPPEELAAAPVPVSPTDVVEAVTAPEEQPTDTPTPVPIVEPSFTATSAPTVVEEPTATSTSLPTATATPAPPTATPTPSTTPSVTPSWTPTFTASPTPVFAVVNAAEGGGAILRAEPGFGTDQITSVLNGTTVQIIDKKPVEANNVFWLNVRIPDGRQGWMLETTLLVATPAPNW